MGNTCNKYFKVILTDPVKKFKSGDVIGVFNSVYTEVEDAIRRTPFVNNCKILTSNKEEFTEFQNESLDEYRRNIKGMKHILKNPFAHSPVIVQTALESLMDFAILEMMYHVPHSIAFETLSDLGMVTEVEVSVSEESDTIH